MRMEDYKVKTDWKGGGGGSHTVSRAFKARRTRPQSGGNHICERIQGFILLPVAIMNRFLGFANLSHEAKAQQSVWNETLMTERKVGR